MIISVGIKAVYFNRKYDRDQRGITILRQVGIICNAIDYDIKGEADLILPRILLKAEGENAAL
jgi:hypothetical protein